MSFTFGQVIFENRHDAGRQLAERLREYTGRLVLVLAIPNGGVPVALEVAIELKAKLDFVVTRKIPVPFKPEAGFGAVADDGTTIFNEELVKSIGLSPQQINEQVSAVRAKIRQRSLIYRGDRPLSSVTGKTAIIIDDGLASGFTMMAAVESLRHRRPKEIVIAVPAASAAAVKRLEKVASRVVTCVNSFAPRFAVADFYRYWHDIDDDEAARYLSQLRSQHLL